jgi:hypothetical protein
MLPTKRICSEPWPDGQLLDDGQGASPHRIEHARQAEHRQLLDGRPAGLPVVGWTAQLPPKINALAAR